MAESNKKKGRKKPLLNSDKIHFIQSEKNFNRSVNRQAEKYKLTEKQKEKLSSKGFVKKKGFKIEIKKLTLDDVARKSGLTKAQIVSLKETSMGYFKVEEQPDFEEWAIKNFKKFKDEFQTGHYETIQEKELRSYLGNENYSYREFSEDENGNEKYSKKMSFHLFLEKVSLWHSLFETATFYLYIHLFIHPKKKQVVFSLSDELIEESRDRDGTSPVGTFYDAWGNYCAFTTDTVTKRTHDKK